MFAKEKWRIFCVQAETVISEITATLIFLVFYQGFDRSYVWLKLIWKKVAVLFVLEKFFVQMAAWLIKGEISHLEKIFEKSQQKLRGVFRIQQTSMMELFCENSYRLKAPS